QDANFNVTAAVSAAGAVAERYVYDPYDKPTFLNPTTWATLGGSGYGWNYLHQGGRYHDFGDGTGLYHFRSRDLSPTLGRWMQEDPLGYVAGDNNLYRYVGNNPHNLLDALGLQQVVPPPRIAPPGGGAGWLGLAIVVADLGFM